MQFKKKSHIPPLGYNVLTKVYDKIVRIFMPTGFRLLLEIENLGNDTTVLDLGTGTGELAYLLLDRNNSLEIYAADINTNALNIAISKNTHKMSNINFIKEDAKDLTFADEKFDKIFCSLFFCCIAHKEKEVIASEIFRVLKSDGMLCICDWGESDKLFKKYFFRLIYFITPLRPAITNNISILKQSMLLAGFKEINEYSSISSFSGRLHYFKVTK